MNQIRFTKEGYKKLKKEYEELLKQRPDAVHHLKTAREMGDLSENGYYKASRAKLSWIDGNLTKYSYYLKMAIIVEDNDKNITTHTAGTVSIGCHVTLFDGKKELSYQIVGDLEANPSEGKISLLSPIGKAVEGKRVNDTIELNVPAGKINYKIINIM